MYFNELCRKKYARANFARARVFLGCVVLGTIAKGILTAPPLYGSGRRPDLLNVI